MRIGAYQLIFHRNGALLRNARSRPPKTLKHGVDVGFKVADVMALSFADQRFDIASVAFGIRNVSDPVKGVRELARVVDPGGAVLVLVFGLSPLLGFREFYNFYSQKILPTICGWVTGKKEAYSYLRNSSANFPCGDDRFQITIPFILKLSVLFPLELSQYQSSGRNDRKSEGRTK